MGRKNKKNNENIENKDITDKDCFSLEENILEYQDIIEKNENIIENYEDDKVARIWDTRNALIEYCNQMAIPLCDYLTFDIFNAFVEYLEEDK